MKNSFYLVSNRSYFEKVFFLITNQVLGNAFKNAFDQLWFFGCISKLKRLGIPSSYCKWIESWLVNRKCFIEINSKRSKWFSIEKGGPQGSALTPIIFIIFHSDIGISLNNNIIDYLEYYSVLTNQPVNLEKSVVMFSARAIGYPNFDIYFNDHAHTKLGWSKLLKSTKIKIRQRISLIKSFKLFGCTSPSLRKALFSSFVLPLFTWIYPIFLLLSKKQQDDLSHYYSTSLRRALFCLHWNDILFSFALDEKMLIDRCASYWNNFLIFAINCLRKSKHYVEHASIIEKVISWLSSVPEQSSNIFYEIDELSLLEDFAITF